MAEGSATPEPLVRLEEALKAGAERDDLPFPPYPAVAVRVQEAMARRGFGLGDLAGLIGADAALAADILRCANSAMYRRGSPVVDLTQALTRIGVQQATRLLLASGLASHAQAVGPLVLLRRMVWIEGLAGAAVCQELARLRGLPSEEAFTLGLLHDFGKIVAIAGLERLLAEERVEGAFPSEAWEAVVERLHVPLGLALARRWHLPASVAEVVAAHHDPAAGCEQRRLCDVVRASDAVVALLFTRAHVSAADLAAIPELAAPERGPLAAVLERVPAFVEAFETPAAAAAVPSSSIERPSTTLPGAARTVRLGVSVSVARRTRTFTASAVTEDGIVMTGEEPLPENRLLEAKVYAEYPFTLWVMCRLCRREGELWRVEVRPFALDGELRALWMALVSGAPPPA